MRRALALAVWFAAQLAAQTVVVGPAGGTLPCSGVDDTSAIQARLTSAGLVRLSGTCVISNHLTIYSNTWLELGQATLTFPNGGDNLLINYAATASATRTFTDAVTTAGSQIMTSATAAFTGADVGQSIWLNAVNTGSVQLQTQILSVTNATTAQLADVVPLSGTGVTAAIYARDANIKVTGGAFGRAGSAGTYMGTYLLRFQGVNNLVLDNLTASWTTGKYFILVADASDFAVTRIVATSSSGGQDGVHVDGPARNGVIRTVRGSTGDDMVALTAWGWTNYDSRSGSIAGMVIEDVSGRAPGAALVRLEGAVGYPIRDVVIRDINGNGVQAAGYAVTVSNSLDSTLSAANQAADIGSVFISTVRGSFTYAKLNLAPTTGREIAIRDYVDHYDTGYPPILIGGTWEKVVIDTLFSYVAGPAVSISGTIKKLYAGRVTTSSPTYWSNLFAGPGLVTNWYINSDTAPTNSGWNNLLYSQLFSNAAWSVASLSLPSSNNTAPDGTSTAFLTQENNTSNQHGIYQSIAQSGPLAACAYVKQATRSIAYLQLNTDSGVKRAWVNLGTGAVGTVDSGITATIAAAPGTGWYKACAIYAGTSLSVFEIGQSSADGTATYTGDNSSGIYIWGAQIGGYTPGGTPAAYRITTTAAVP